MQLGVGDRSDRDSPTECVLEGQPRSTARSSEPGGQMRTGFTSLGCGWWHTMAMVEVSTQLPSHCTEDVRT